MTCIGKFLLSIDVSSAAIADVRSLLVEKTSQPIINETYHHAVSDALLGALGLGDIGKYFPPSDPSIAGIDSLLIVKKCLAMVKEKGYEVHNVDVSISAQEPKLAPFILEMKGNLALALEIKESQTSIKAMTNEGLDAVGKGEAIKASAILLLMKE